MYWSLPIPLNIHNTADGLFHIRVASSLSPTLYSAVFEPSIFLQHFLLISRSCSVLMAFGKLYLRHHEEYDVSSLFSHLARCNFSGLIQFYTFMQLQKEEEKKEKIFQLEGISSFVMSFFFVNVEERKKINKLLICCGENEKILGLGTRKWVEN